MITATAVTALLAAGAPAVVLPPAQATTQTGTWTLTGPLNVPRYDHSTTALADGRVLAAGGRSPDLLTRFNSAETFDAVTGTWTAVAPMAVPRFRHTATRLADGRVLIAGGFGGSPGGSATNAQPVLTSAEIYDPVTNTWTPTGAMNVRRALHSAVLLDNGKVLVAGGRTCNAPPPAACDATFRTATAELFDPATGTWTPTGSMSIERHTTAAAKLTDGKVLVPAGFTSAGTGRTADRYDPVTGTWSFAGTLFRARARQGAMPLNDGRVLVALGFEGGQTTETYSPAANSWTRVGDLVGHQTRFNFSYAVLPNGFALVAGGAVVPPGPTQDARLFDPATNSWIQAAAMNVPHGSSSSLANSDLVPVLTTGCGSNCGKVLVAGNHPGGASELFTFGVFCDGRAATITGSDGADQIAGTAGDDVIVGGGGRDNIQAGGGNDVVCGGSGDDSVDGGTGDDTLFGEAGADRLYGGGGNDTTDGGADSDQCVGETLVACP